MLGSDPLLALIAGTLALAVIVIGIVFLRWWSIRRGGGKQPAHRKRT